MVDRLRQERADPLLPEHGDNMIVPTLAGRHARMVLALTACSVLCVTADAALAQTTPNPVPGGCETPASQRPKDEGCYLSASQELGVLPQSARFWHMYNYPTRAAAEAIKGPHGPLSNRLAERGSSPS